MNFILIGVLIAVAAVGVGARFLFKKTDSPVEEIAERIIENQTGYKIDLSPDTEDPDTGNPDTGNPDDLQILMKSEFDMLKDSDKADQIKAEKGDDAS